MYTYNDNIVSDLHKDARGFRPSEYFWEEWTQAPADVKQIIWDDLCDELAENSAREQREQERALKGFWGDIRQNRSLGAKDDLTAIRWILEAEDFSEYDLAYGADYVAWHFGLAYNNPLKADIQAAIDKMREI